jgi:hypothetical protein
MLLGVYKKVRKPSLYINVESIRGLVRDRRWRIAFRAVPRQMNAQADDMCRRAEAAGNMVEYCDGMVPEDAPWIDVTTLHEAVEDLWRNSTKVFRLCAVVDRGLAVAWR